MEQPIIANDGLQFVPQIAVQYVYLDFDGETTTYHNKDLEISLDVKVEDSGMSEEQKRYILAELSEKYASENIVFTVEKPEDNIEYSTIFIGQTDDFEEYGSFAGLAETIDKGNQIKNDNAFVLTNSVTDPETVISVIDHEIGHIVEGKEHAAAAGGLEDYASADGILLNTATQSYTVSVSCTGGANTYGKITVQKDSFTITLPSNADYMEISISVTESHRGKNCDDWNSSVYITLNGKTYVDNVERYLTSASASVQLSKEAYIQSIALSPIIHVDNNGHIYHVGYNYASATAYNKVTVTVNYYKRDDTPPAITFFSANSSYENAQVTVNATDSFSNITQYYVEYWYYDADGVKRSNIQQSNSYQVNLTNLMPGTTYTYRVAAQDRFNNRSEYSATQTFTTQTDTDAPVFTGNITYASTGNNITLAWNAATDNASVANYEVVFNGTIYNTGVNRTLTLNDVTPGHYTYSVTALDKTGNRSVALSGTTQVCTVATDVTGQGSLNINAGNVFSGTQITVTATPDAHQLLASFRIDGTDQIGNTANINVNKDTQISAAFRPMEQYAVTLKSNFNALNSLLSVTGTDKNEDNDRFYETSSVTFTAADNKGYRFDYWLINGTQYTEQTLTLNNLSADLNAEAVYSIYDINFNIPSRTPEDDFIINDFSSVTGMPSYSITLGTYYTKPGVYKLMSNAAGFNETVQVFTGSTLLGTLLPNGIPLVNKEVVSRYLTIEDGNLLLTIKDNLYIYNGETLQNQVISSYYHGIVERGGTLNGVSVISGGQLLVSGRVNDATVCSGSMYVYSGGSASKVIVNTPDFIAVYQDGEITDTTLGSGGRLYVDGKASGTTINDQGWLFVNTAGQGIDTVVNYGGNLVISDEGRVNFVTINYGGSMSVKDSGSADNITLCSGGSANVSSGGTIQNTNLGDASLRVQRNGTASNTTINSGGYMDVTGTAVNTTVNSGGIMDVSSNGTASNTTVNSGGYMYVSKGKTVTGITVNFGGTMNISGGTATEITENGGFVAASRTAEVTFVSNTIREITLDNLQSMTVHKNTTAESTTVNSGGEVHIYSGGAAKSTTVNFGGEMHIYSGGAAESSTVNSGGEMYIYSGGTATEVTENGGFVSVADGANVTFVSNTLTGIVLSDGMTVHSNTTAHNTTVNYGGGMYIKSGGIANSTTVYSRGYMYISGGVANSTTVNSEGYMYIESGGVANSTTVNYDGCLRIESGGVANSTTVNSGGYMYIKSGGTATNVIWTPCLGTLTVDRGASVTYAASYSGVYYREAHSKVLSHTNSMTDKSIGDFLTEYMYVMNNGIANNTVIESNGNMYISSGGTANNTIQSAGFMFVGGGTVNSTTLDGGRMTIDSNSLAQSTTVNSGGNMYIYSGGTANSIAVNRGGKVVVSGGIVTQIIENGGYVYVAPEANVTFISNTLNGIVLNDGMTVHSNTTAHNTTVNYQGGLYIRGGIANSTTVNSGGGMYISSGGVTNSTTVNYGGSMSIESGGTAIEIKENGGYVRVASGANVTFVSNTIREITLDNLQSMTVHSNTIANSTTVNSRGYMVISSGGMANNTTLSGGTYYYESAVMHIESGGVANSTTVYSGGYMYISSGGIHRGSLQIDSGAVVSAYEGGIIDFTVSDRTASDGYLINSLSRISKTATYTITVSAEQSAGIYKLAQDAAGFTGNISIGDGNVNYGTVTVNGNTLVYNAVSYQLTLSDGNLHLAVNSTVEPELSGDKNGVSFSGISGDAEVKFSKDNFSNILQITPTGNAVDTYGVPSGTYQWQVCAGGICYQGDDIVSDNNAAAQSFISDADGNMDVFFAGTDGVWKAGNAVEHQGSLNGWTGTEEKILLKGKNKIADVFTGSDDANVLVLTDSANGDALFVEDIYTSFGKDAARIAQIDEIRAGAGDDIIDMTSQRFAYVGDGVKIYGGLGNDTIWANSGSNTLFGDTENDRIVGGSDDDVIIGGSGNDALHGGGGDDIFCFGGNWGSDTVEQLADGEITLWFESGSESNWNADTLTYTDGANSVTVSGVSADNITLKFGDDNSLRYDDLAASGCFDNAASEKIFEDKNKGFLA